MIIKNEEQTKLEFGNGDISIAGGYTTGNTVKGFVVFENQEARKIGSPGITKKGETDLNDYDVVMTFSKKESVDALIKQLELTKTYMGHKEECSCHRFEENKINNKKSYNNGVKVLPTKSTERPNPQPNNPNTGQEKKWQRRFKMQDIIKKIEQWAIAYKRS